MSSSLIDVLRPNPPVDLADMAVPTAVSEYQQRDLLHALATVPDPRDPRGVRYPLVSRV